MLYKRISRSLFENKLVPLDYDIQTFINEKPNADYYESLYRYTEAHKKRKLEETKEMEEEELGRDYRCQDKSISL